MEKSFGMRRLESLPQTLCPQCKARVRLNPKTISERIFPFLGLFQKRVCGNCDYQWTTLRLWWLAWFSKEGLAWRVLSMTGFILAILYTIILIFTTSLDPVAAMKKIVRAGYGQTYEAQESRQKL